MIPMIITVQLLPPKPIVSAAGGQVYYVSVDGNDSHSGSIDSPWQTIQKAADTVAAGDTVIVRGGIYKEFVKIRTSGSKSQGYITFQAYPGEKPVIDGSELAISSGKSALISLSDVSYIIVDGFELRNLSTASSSEYPAAIKVQKSGSDIHILNNNVHHIVNSSSRGNAHGILVYGSSTEPLTNIRISGNEVHHLITGSSESVTVNGNVDGFSVENNIVHDNNNIGIDIAGFYGACANPCTDQARNGTVSGNTVYNIDSYVNPAYNQSNSAPGIYADGSANVVIERNHIYASDFGISIGSENTGKNTSGIIVRNNYIHHNENAGIVMGGSGLSNGGAIDNKIINNTIVENDTWNRGFGEIALQHHTYNNIISNNVFFSSAGKTFVQKLNQSGSGNVSDYNLYYKPDGENGSPWYWSGTKYRSWNDYKKATGFDANSLFADPMFVNKSKQDVHLSSGSPAIDGGSKDLPVGTLDFDGNARIAGKAVDIGAFELMAGVTPEPTPEPTPDPAPKPEPSPEPGPVTGNGTIKVDGDISDWSEIPALSEGRSNVQRIKALADGANLHVLITGTLLEEKGQLYIDSDGSGETGFQAPFWSSSGIDYLLENGILYKYSGIGGTDWSWKEVKEYIGTPNFMRTNTVIEASLELADMGIKQGGTFRMGYAWKDSAEHKLPNTRELITYEIPLPPQPAPPLFTIDGSKADWEGTAALRTGSSNPRTLKAANDMENLYFLVEGSKLSSKTQFYLDTDNSGTSGYKASYWSGGGADYLVENGTLYQYSGDGKNWSWKKVIALKSIAGYIVNEELAEASIPLKTLNIAPGAAIGVCIVLNDSKATQLPASGAMASYTLK